MKMLSNTSVRVIIKLCNIIFLQKEDPQHQYDKKNYIIKIKIKTNKLKQIKILIPLGALLNI